MKPSPSYAVLLTLIFFHATQAQKIVYSPPEKTDYNRFRFEVITKRDGKILVFKALYYGNPFHRQPSAAFRQSYSNPNPLHDNDGAATGPDNSIEGSALCMYDSDMHIISEKTLPLPREITGVHFLVYDTFFYVFYQHRIRHTIYCLATKVGMDGEIIGPAVKMDSTEVFDINYQSQIYSVIYSEDKQQILAFNINLHRTFTVKSATVKSILFDKDLHPLRTTSLPLSMDASQYLSEFNIDNEGNFIFVGMNGKAKPHDEMQAALFVQPRTRDSLYTTYFVPGTISVDNVRLLIDNKNKKYILSSFYSRRPEASIEGLFCFIHDAKGYLPGKASLTVLSDSLRRAAKKSGIKMSLNDYYIQDLHLRANGSFTIEAQQLNSNPDEQFISRWNYLPELKEQVATEFAWYDPYENDHYYPWKLWHRSGSYPLPRYTFSSRGTLITSFDSAGLIEWVNVINTPQFDMIDVALGYKTIIANGLLYFLFNTRIRQSTFLSARSIDAAGTLDTDTRFREDLALRDQDNAYECFPRLAKVIDAGEIIVPCRKGGYFCLAKINF